MSTTGARVKVILQQCLSAKLQVQPATEENQAEFVTVGRGLIVYVCFMDGAEKEKNLVDKLVKIIFNVRLKESSDAKTVSVLDLPGDILIVPQSTLGGRIRGKSMQFHGNIDKQIGSELYSNLVQKCRDMMAANGKSVEAGCRTEAGAYGNKEEVFSMESNGPYAHIVEL